MSSVIKKTIFLALMLFIALRVLAPVNRALMITEGTPVQPFTRLIHAIGMVETKLDTFAYNPEEHAVGYFQIRPIRLHDYNIRTDSHYTMKDLYNYKISEKIFLFYASGIGPYNFEEIAKRWNGSGEQTDLYWKNVKSRL
ncbi:MAG TPA: hypothetical protein VJ963_11120 [Bacteroidales bacterium]|nr:hypothetical protein [Bacteroidales bacterium]